MAAGGLSVPTRVGNAAGIYRPRPATTAAGVSHSRRGEADLVIAAERLFRERDHDLGAARTTVVP
jgi:hypothetical protein